MIEAPARSVNSRPVGELAPYAANARTHSAAQLEQLVRSIDEFGWTNPVLVDATGIIAGHGRVLAAQQIYAEGRAIRLPSGDALPAGTVPTLDCTGWSDGQRRAYILADNQLALNAGWDEALLAQEMGALRGLGVDLTLVGFSDERMDALLAAAEGAGGAGGGGGNTDPDDAPSAPPEPHTRPGDIWLLGTHRVICADSTKPEALALLMGGGMADCVWTDPPYNVAYKTAAGAIKNDDMADAAFRQFLVELFASMSSAMREGAAVYVAHADTEGLNFRAAFAAAGLKLSACVIWRKDSLVLGRSDYQWCHEPILYGWKPGKRHRWFGGRKQTTLALVGEELGFRQTDDGRWQIAVGDNVLIIDADAKVEQLVPSIVFHAKPRRSADHPTMKPVALIEKQLRNSARPGDTVLDVCGGSGSTLIAAHRLGMNARLCELDPKYVDVIVRRWQEYTGARASHAVTGAEFPA